MLRWITYIKSLNLERQHISGKDNAMVDMLSRASFDDDEGMVSEDEEVGVGFFESAQITAKGRSTPPYEGEWLRIGRYLLTLTPDAVCTKEEVNRIRKKAYRFFLQDGSIWKHLKKRIGIPLRLVIRREEQKVLLSVYHERPLSGHRRTWATFEKLK